MRHLYEPQHPKKPQELAELAEPREARPSGAIRMTADAGLPGENDHTLRFGFQISRPNAPVPITPSILVDASYLQAVSSVVDRIHARRRKLALAATCAFLCGALTLPLTAELVRRMAAPVTAPAYATSVTKNVGTSMRTPLVPNSASSDSEPPRPTRMDQRDAARLVRGAQELRRAGRVRDAWRLLADVLQDRSGYPPGLAAMAELELDRGRAVAGVRWARLAVSAHCPRRSRTGSSSAVLIPPRACTRRALAHTPVRPSCPACNSKHPASRFGSTHHSRKPRST